MFKAPLLLPCRKLASRSPLRRIRASHLDTGQDLYAKAKAAYDGCITDLKASLDRRFVDEDEKRIEQKLTGANGEMLAFLARPCRGFGSIGSGTVTQLLAATDTPLTVNLGQPPNAEVHWRRIGPRTSRSEVQSAVMSTTERISGPCGSFGWLCLNQRLRPCLRR
jgi:hypothetical protein